MGRNTTTPSPASLDRFSTGEIVDLTGVASFYDAGTSKWLKSGTFVDGSSLSSTTKSILAASATSTSNATVALATANDLGLATSYPVMREDFMIARISSISTTVILRSLGSSAVAIMTINSSGATNQTLVSSSQLGSGGTVSSAALLSNGSKFFVYYYTNTSTLACLTSTDGLTWITESLSGLPTISGVDSNSGFWDFSNTNNVNPKTGYKYTTTSAASYGSYANLWCGARVLCLTRAGSGNFLASLSTDGLVFGSSDTTAVLGSTSISHANHINFYRNGNNCFLAIGTTYRKSTDGGATWSAATFAAAPNSSQHNNIPNLTDPTKRIINPGDGNSEGYYTSDSGATWSTNRVFPQPSRWGIVYKGSTVVSSYADGVYRSVDDGVTWTPVVFPAGTNVGVGQVCADDVRFYFIPYGGGAQLLTSTDAITWTIRTTPGTVSGTGGWSVNKVSSNVVYLTNQLNQGIFTLDGGVTWSFAKTATSDYGNNFYGYYQKATTDGPNGGYMICGLGAGNSYGYNFLLSSAALTAGGQYYRTGPDAITPVRSGAFSYVRVG